MSKDFLYATVILCFLLISPAAFADGFCGTQPRSPEQSARLMALASTLAPADTLAEPVVLDVLLLYTPQAVIGAGGEDTLRKQILENIEDANRRFTNSLINVRLRPAYIGMINYTESGSMFQDGVRLINATGGLERSRTLREDYKADITLLVTELENSGFGGDSWSISPPTGGDAPNAFCLVRRLHLRFPMVMAHEFGHLLGCDHTREHSTYPLTDAFYKLRFPYIFGCRFEIEGVRYADTMSYPPGVYLPLFGNPEVVIDGVPTGVPETDPQPANTAKTINQIAPYVAKYRTAMSRIEFATNRLLVLASDSSATVHLKRTGDLTAATRVTVVIDPTSTAVAGVDYVRTGTISVSFAANQAATEFALPLLANGFQTGEKILQVRLTSPQGNHGIGWLGTMSIGIRSADAPPGFYDVTFPDAPLSVRESEGVARVRIVLGTKEPAVLSYYTEDRSGAAGVDYESVAGTFSHSSGGDPIEISIPIHNRVGITGERSFVLVAGGRTNEIRILDDDLPGAVLSAPGNRLEPNAGLNVKLRGDGKLLLWGHFSRIAGRNQSGIALANADGSLNETFQPPEILIGHRALPGLPNPFIGTVEPLPDGSFLVGRLFSRMDGQPRLNVAKLRADGSLDTTFNSKLGFDGAVYSMARQKDGRILISGLFRKAAGEEFPWLVRVTEDGELDHTFKPNITKVIQAGEAAVVLRTVLVQPDGRILVGGGFDRVDGNPSTNFARLNADGSLDSAFKIGSGISDAVHRVALQPDGRILVAGRFLRVSGRSSPRIARLLPDGTFDSSFRSPTPDSDVKDVIPLPDGRILISGFFTKLGKTSARFMAVLRQDGSIDPEFDFGTGPDDMLGNEVTYGFGDEATGRALALSADGTLYVSGAFHHFNGLPASNLVRLRFGEIAPTLSISAESSVAIQGVSGGSYILESSADLANWKEERLFQLGDSAKIDIPLLSEMPSHSHRFFRLKTR